MSDNSPNSNSPPNPPTPASPCDVAAACTPGSIDRETVFLWNHWLANSPYKKMALTISTIIGPHLIYVVGVILLIYALVTKIWDGFFHFWGVCLLGVIVFLSIKYGINRRRPFLKDPRIIRLDPRTHRTSFPSGHSFWVSLVLLFIGVHFNFPWWVLILLYDFSIAISFGRIALGAHYPTDLMVGHLLAPICIAVYYWLFANWWSGVFHSVLGI